MRLDSACSGCGLCVNVCPTNAIKMVLDDSGFFKPVIDQSICKDCGLCKNLCLKEPLKNSFEILSLAVKNKNDAVRKQSSSGGLFYAIAKKLIANKGVVYGAKYDNENLMCVHHARITEEADINLLMGSKYVQSDIAKTYRLVESDLKNNLLVCFSGTPCQVNALKTYLEYKKVDDSNLITCDFVCHGVPSPEVWREYVKLCEKKFDDKMEGYSFRHKDKSCFWGSVNVCAKFINKEVVNDNFIRSYIDIYFSNLMTRKDCQQCKFAKLERVSDITMADCWGLEKVVPDFYDKWGVSLMLINTQKGLNLFNNISSCFETTEIDVNKLEQPHLNAPCVLSHDSEKFWRIFRKNGYVACAKKFTKYGFLHRNYKAFRSFLGGIKSKLMGAKR